jgi:REP element-mobilizing transposase RayT
LADPVIKLFGGNIMTSATLQPGKFYHIYNRGINDEDLFRDHEDYSRFLNLYEKYIFPVCETYAWELMKNHFHVLLSVKENIVYKYSNDDGSFSPERFNEIKWETTDLNEDILHKIPLAQVHLSHLFNSYAKYYNLKYERHGTLFERPFKRKEVGNHNYFRTLIVYIHQNPVHHGFVEHPLDYGWSSYLTCISFKSTRLKREIVIGWFDGMANFKQHHDKELNVENIDQWLEL